MTQKSILSFFVPKSNASAKSSPVESADNEATNCPADDSPIKSVSTRKRIRIPSSSSESESENSALKNENDKISTAAKKITSKLPKIDVLEESFNNEEKEEQKNTNKIASPIKEKKKTKKKIKEEIVESLQISENSDKAFTSNTAKKCESYNPNLSKYHPVNHATWSKGEKVPYLALARTFEEIENESGRLKMIEILANFFRSVIVLTPEDLLPSIYLSLNKLGPAYEGLELGLAEHTLIKAISQSTGRTVVQIKNEIQEVGDIGMVAEKSRVSQKLMFKPPPLTVRDIFKKFTEIANMKGKTVVNKKITIIETLYVACKGPEARFMMRSLNGKLRIGLAEQSVLQALALACALNPPEEPFTPKKLDLSATVSKDSLKSQVDDLAMILKTTYCECPNYGKIIPVLLKEGIEALPEHCKITPGVPMKPMLAQPTKGVQEVLTRFEGLEFTCEWKYDGERAQIHCTKDGIIKIYSRNQENNTAKYPDIIDNISHTKKDLVTSFILDCEAVAWDKENKKILPFQVLSTRKKKDVNNADIKIPVCVYMFDLLYLNGKSLVKENFYERRRLLRENFLEVEGEWMFATSIDTSKMEEVEEFLDESVKGNCEGLMVKTLKEEATYEIAKRSRNWLKLKKDYLEGLGDTLDLVVIGGYLGKGKRTGTYGGFLVACYDPDTEEYQSVCKLGTGFSDEDLMNHTKFFKGHLISQPPSYYQYDSTLEPDHWFQAVQVWETKCADLSLSSTHRAGIGMVDPEKGISLRFPRFLRIRDDKSPEEASSTQQLIHMYQNQEQVKSQQGKMKFKEEDFY